MLHKHYWLQLKFPRHEVQSWTQAVVGLCREPHVSSVRQDVVLGGGNGAVVHPRPPHVGEGGVHQRLPLDEVPRHLHCEVLGAAVVVRVVLEVAQENLGNGDLRSLNAI